MKKDKWGVVYLWKKSRKKRSHMKHSDFLDIHIRTERPDEDLQQKEGSSMLLWIATCSTRNHAADQLCSNRCPAMVTSLFTWFSSASKSCFIEGTSGESQNIPEVPVTTLEFVYRHSPTRRQKGPVAAAIAIFTASWMSQGRAEPAVAMYVLPHVVCQNQEGFVLISVCYFFTKSWRVPLPNTCSLCIFLKGIATLVSFHFLFPLLHHSFSTSASLFVEGKPFLYSSYSADSVRFYSGTTEVRELRSRGKSDGHGKNTNTSYSCFSTRENIIMWVLHLVEKMEFGFTSI